MAGLDPAIQSLFGSLMLAGWMAAAGAAMTVRDNDTLRPNIHICTINPSFSHSAHKSAPNRGW